jgi:sRNA-binding regulator protein Hfq
MYFDTEVYITLIIWNAILLAGGIFNFNQYYIILRYACKKLPIWNVIKEWRITHH